MPQITQNGQQQDTAAGEVAIGRQEHSLADPEGFQMSTPTDMLPELSCATPWPKGTATHLHGKLRRIQRAYTVGHRRQLRYPIQQYLTSFDPRFAASCLAASKLRWYRRPKKTELKTIAEGLNAFQGTREEVRLQLIPKDGNVCRPTLDFGIENRALQYLVRPVLLAIAELHPRQFAARGGVPAAIAQVVNAMNRGYRHAREIDIGLHPVRLTAS